MLLHVYNGGSIEHISVLYKAAGIAARFVSCSYVRSVDLDNRTAVVVDSLESLKSLEPLLMETILYEGGKPSFKAMMGSSIVTHTVAGKSPIRLMAGMSSKQLYTRQGKVIYHKLLQKITRPERYVKVSPPNIKQALSDKDILLYAENRAKELGGEIVFIAEDTETKQEGIITGKCGTSYWVYSMIELFQATFVTRLPSGVYDLFTVVIPFKTRGQYENIKKISGSPYPKIMSNGLYDIEQLLHWQIPVVNFAWDVEFYPRSVTPDLSGFYSLGMSAAMWCLNVKAWKDLTDHKTDRNMAQQRAFLLYSGLDTHHTAATALNQMVAAKGQNLKNYMMRSELDGLSTFMNLQLLLVDKEKNAKFLEDATNRRVENGEWFKKATGLDHTQGKKIKPLFETLHMNMRVLGYKDMGKLASLQEKELSGIINSHPIWSQAVEKFLDAKHGEKDGSTFIQFIKYYTCQDLTREQPYFDYSMNQYIAATLRYASSKSNAWCGGNVMNIPGYYRTQYVMPEGQVAFSIDAPQSEARTVGHLAECQTILRVLQDPDLDYHKFNAAHAVFQVEYDDVTSLMRKLSKPVGFGFFYGQTFVGLLKELRVDGARRLRAQMGLDPKVPLTQVARMASLGIDRLYWEIRKKYYPKVVDKYRHTSRVPCITGFSPILFGDINKGETVRTVVCIDGQHTSAYINIAGGVKMLYRFLYGTKPIERATYPFLQLHDEIQARTSDEFTVREIDEYTEELFANSHMVHGREMVIPRGIPVFGKNMGELKNDEIERTEEVLNMTLKEVVK